MQVPVAVELGAKPTTRLVRRGSSERADLADGVGIGLCAGCHDGAPRDNVFPQVR